MKEITMKSSTRDKAKGMFHQMKGKAKEVAGNLTDNPKLEAEGTGEKMVGKAQERWVRSRKFGGSSKRISGSNKLKLKGDQS